MAKTKRILMLLENNAYRRDVRVRQEAQSLTEYGYHVTVIGPRAPGGKFYDTVDGVVLYSFPAPPSGEGLMGYAVEYGYAMIMMSFMSFYVWLRHGFDAMHLHNPPDTLVFIAMFYKLLGKPFVFDHHDLSPELYYYSRYEKRGNQRVYQLLIWLETLSCRMANHVIVTNESYRELDMERAHLPLDRVTIVRNGPDLRQFDAAVSPSQPNDRVMIGYLGVIGFQDGVDHLIRAIHHLVTVLKCTDFTCLIVGSGSELEHIQQLSRELQLEPYITFTGWVDYKQVPDYVSRFDLCAAPEQPNPYNHRCTMIKLMEYMAFAKPIVAFDLVEHRRTAEGSAVYASSHEDFAQKLALLISDPDMRLTMGALGRQRVETTLAWEHQAQALRRVYDTLFQKG